MPPFMFTVALPLEIVQNIKCIFCKYNLSSFVVLRKSSFYVLKVENRFDVMTVSRIDAKHN